MVGPKKHQFWPKINILKGNHCILRMRGAPICQKLAMILENKVVQKLKLEKNVFHKKWSPILIFLCKWFFFLRIFRQFLKSQQLFQIPTLNYYIFPHLVLAGHSNSKFWTGSKMFQDFFEILHGVFKALFEIRRFYKDFAWFFWLTS